MQRRSATLPIATLLFFLSGALGLGYELVWIRKATLVVGASQIALSTVLTAFFFGLGLGSYVFGRHFRSRGTSPLVLYGALEAAIGIYALLLPHLFRLTETAYALGYPLVAGSAATLFAWRFLLLFALFLPPTLCMGGTLPLLLDAVASSDRTIGSRTSLLYGVNILGAVAGVLVTGYWAIPALGANGASRAGGVGNLLVGAVAVLAFRGSVARTARHSEVPLERFHALAALASGLLAIAYQICWFRYFTLFNFSTVYLTSLLLAVYLACLALGSLLLAPLLRRGLAPLRVLGWAQALVPLATIATLGAWRLADYQPQLLRETTADGGSRPVQTFELAMDAPRFWQFFSETADAIFFAPLAQLALVLLVPVTLIGAGLPAIITAAARHADDLRSVSGRLVFWNTLGSAAGGFLAGYVLLPLLGLHWTLGLLGLGSLVFAAAVQRRVRASTPGATARIREALAVAVPLVLFLAWIGSRDEITRATIRSYQLGTRNLPDFEFEQVIEGPLTTAYLTRDERALRLGSGSVQMGNVLRSGVNMQVIAGHMPVLFYPGEGLPQDCLGLCLGSGQSFGALLGHPIRRLDVVEISSEIVRLALGPLAPFNRDLGRDERVTIHLDDARHYVERAATASYDLVSMESGPPTSDGVYSLYSLEFYREVKRVLRPGGVFMQFLPLYFLTPLDARATIKTMAQVFPEMFVAKMTHGDYILLGFASPPRFSVRAMRERSLALAGEWAAQSPPWSKWDARAVHPIASFEGVASTLIAGPEQIRALESPLLYDDDRGLLSYSTGDRWLARRYGGTALINLSFAALPLAEIETLRDYFVPPLSREQVVELTGERLAALGDLNVRDPADLRRKVADLERATDPGLRGRLALSIALDFDAALNKREALRFAALAIEATSGHPERIEAQHLSAGRKIVRNRLAVYVAEIEAALRPLERSHAGSPLLAAMREELDAYLERRSRDEARYLFPGAWAGR